MHNAVHTVLMRTGTNSSFGTKHHSPLHSILSLLWSNITRPTTQTQCIHPSKCIPESVLSANLVHCVAVGAPRVSRNTLPLSSRPTRCESSRYVMSRWPCHTCGRLKYVHATRCAVQQTGIIQQAAKHEVNRMQWHVWQVRAYATGIRRPMPQAAHLWVEDGQQ